MTEKGTCISDKGSPVQCYLKYKHSPEVKYWLIDLYGNTQVKPNLTEADTGYSRSVPCPALPDGLLFDPTKQSQEGKLILLHQHSLLLTHLTYLP